LSASVQMSCEAHVADRLGSPLVATVMVWAEAGVFSRESGLTSASGVLSVNYTTGAPLPVDVDPETFSWTPATDAVHTGALLVPQWMRPDRWVHNPALASAFLGTLQEPRRPDPLRPNLTNNPRDNLVTLIVMAEGEEQFTDENANGTFDVGEDFVDLTEPFVDADDDGTWDASERFSDANGNGVWDGKNGRWDHQTRVWAAHRILWTGLPDALDAEPTVAGVAGHRPSVARNPVEVSLLCPAAGNCDEAGPPQVVSAYLGDPWFNELTRARADDGCRLVAAPSVVVSAQAGLATGVQEQLPAGTQFSFTVEDARAPGSSTPRRSPPLAFTVSVECALTAGPGAQRETVTFPAATGVVE
jgi:hypothetical protein